MFPPVWSIYRALHTTLQKQRSIGPNADLETIVETLKQIGEFMVYGDRQSEQRNNDRFFEYVRERLFFSLSSHPVDEIR